MPGVPGSAVNEMIEMALRKRWLLQGGFRYMGVRIATTSDIGHWFRNDRRFYKGRGTTGRRGRRPLRVHY